MSEYSDAIEEARAELAEVAADVLLDTCTHKRPPVPQPVGGGEEDEPETIEEDVPCEAEPLSVFQRVVAQSINASATHKIKLPATKQLQPMDLLIVAERGATPEQTFQVFGDITKPQDLWRFVLGTLQ
ncbi:MAG TPA: hypothetical protein VGB17_06925 [Pyrinomonadaceae bacterium]|jgi:hypothetical protein